MSCELSYRLRTTLLLTFVEGDISDKLSIIRDPAFARAAVWLIHTPESSPAADNLMAAVRSRDPSRPMRATPISACWSSAGVAETLSKLVAEALVEHGAGIVANLSDGPGIAPYVAERLFRDAGIERFVVDPRSDRLVWLPSSGAESGPRGPAGQPIADTLSLYEYLRAHGFHVQSCVRKPPADRSGVTRAILRAPPGVSSLLQTFATHAVPDQRGRYVYRDRQLSRHPMQAILAQLSAAGLAEVSDGAISLSDGGAKHYVAGGWLESHVGHCLEQMQAAGLIQHYLLNVKIDDGRETAAEIDAAFLANNNLFVVECKAQRNAKSRTWLDGVYAIADQLDAKGILALNADLLPMQEAMAAAKLIALIGRGDLIDVDRLEQRFSSLIRGGRG